MRRADGQRLLRHFFHLVFKLLLRIELLVFLEPFCMERARFIDALVGVRAEIIALCLEQIRGNRAWR